MSPLLHFQHVSLKLLFDTCMTPDDYGSLQSII